MKTYVSFRYAAWLLIALGSLSVCGCFGCTAQDAHRADTSKQKTPITWDLSPEAQTTYASLLFEHALRQDDEALLLAALEGIHPYTPPVSSYVEALVWLMGHQSSQVDTVLAQALALYPEDISLNLLFAERLQDLGHNAAALAHMQAYAKKHPESNEAKLELALLYVKNNQYPKALQTLASIPTTKRTPLVEYYHARALIGMGREADAMPYLRKALKGAPEFLEAMIELAHIHEQRQEYREARALYEAMLRHGTLTPELLLRVANISLRLQQPERAKEVIRQGPNTADFKIAAASIYMNHKIFDQAEALLLSCLTLPEVPTKVYYYLAALAYNVAQDTEKALNLLNKVTPQSDMYAKAIMTRLEILHSAQRWEEALATIRGAITLQPEAKELYDMEVRLLAQQKRYTEALERATLFARRWPDDAHVAFLRASLLEEMEQRAEAFAAMEAIIAAHPEYFQALNYVGYTLAEQNRDIPRALELLHKAVALSPRSDYILDSLAWAQYRAGKLAEAWDNITKAVELAAQPDVTIWEHYARIADAIGNKAAARKGYTKALELNPPNAQDLKERMGKL